MNDKIFFSVHKTITLQIKKRIENQRMSSEQEIQAFFLCSMLSFCRISPTLPHFCKPLYYTLNQKSGNDWFGHFSR